ANFIVINFVIADNNALGVSHFRPDGSDLTVDQAVINAGERNVHQKSSSVVASCFQTTQDCFAICVRCSHSSSTFMLSWLSTSSRASGRERPLITRRRGLRIASIAAAFHGLPHCKSTAISHSS